MEIERYVYIYDGEYICKTNQTTANTRTCIYIYAFGINEMIALRPTMQ